ncbi:MAG: M28 family peptidase, partial [Chloroflexi bacterium]|nr:M28 family peptidase [Chloroflexota bacterium]
RSQTWMVFYPALAFFLAVLGFNLLGEGLRRIVQKRGVSTAFILSKRMALIVLAVTLATAYIITHVGPAPSYAGLAQRFDAEAALSHVAALADPLLAGRQVGTSGADAAAAYIAQCFAAYGLETIHAGVDYRLPFTSRIVTPTEQPELTLLDSSGRTVHSFAYRRDFGADINGHGGGGEANAPLTLLTFSKTDYRPEDFAGLDLRDRIVLYLAEQAPFDFAVEALLRGARGILFITEDITPRLQLAKPGGEYLRPITLPIFRLHPTAADLLLSSEGLRVEELLTDSEAEQAIGGWHARELGLRAHMRLVLSPVQEVTTDNVVAVFRGADAQLNKQLVVVAAHYDGIGAQPDGTILHGANEATSGVAVMLEILRLWTSTGFQPRRTILFAAWAGGEWEHSGAHEYLAAQATYSTLETVAVVNLDGLGGEGSELLISGGSKLTDLLLRCAESSGVAARVGQATNRPYHSAFRAEQVTVGWSDDSLQPAEDTWDKINAAQLGAAGQVINLALITMGREYDY